MIIIYIIVAFIFMMLGVFLGVWGTIHASDMLSEKDKEKILKKIGGCKCKH